ncbi:DM13 domain-containing protein [uncultured Nostoc sp.]
MNYFSNNQFKVQAKSYIAIWCRKFNATFGAANLSQ